MNEQPIHPPIMGEEHHRKTHLLLMGKAILLMMIGEMEIELSLELKQTRAEIQSLKSKPATITFPVARIVTTNGNKVVMFEAQLK